MTIFQTILLRNLPKSEVRMDLMQYRIEGTFRGFREVPSTNPHYVSVKVGDAFTGFWCYGEAGDVLVKTFDQEGRAWRDETPKKAARYREMASDGGLDDFLMPYDQTTFTAWHALTHKLPRETFPPNLYPAPNEDHPEGLDDAELRKWVEARNRQRLQTTFYEQHEANISGFLAEMQFSFLRWLVEGEESGFARWGYLLQTLYHAELSEISEHPNLFAGLVDVIIPHFEFLPTLAFTAGGMARFASGMLAENMRAIGGKLGDKADALDTAVQARAVE